MTAKKYDKGKPRPDLVLGTFMPALQHLINVGSYGCFKYEPKNFENLPNGEERYADAGLRHYVKRKLGEVFDDETGEFHLAHEIWDKVAELYFYLKEREDTEYVLTIKYDCQYFDGDNWGDKRYWFDEEPGRRAIWELMANGVTDIKVDKRPIMEVEEIWGVVDVEGTEKIETAFNFGTVDDNGTEIKNHTCKPRPSQSEEFAKMVGPKFTAEHPPMDEQKFGIWNPVLDRWYAGYGTWEQDPKLAIEFSSLAVGTIAAANLESIVDQQVCEVRSIPAEPFGVRNIHTSTWAVSEDGIVWSKHRREALRFATEDFASNFIANVIGLARSTDCVVRKLL